MNLCTNCEKEVTSDMDRVELIFYGNWGRRIGEITKQIHLNFCSFSCFLEYTVTKLRGNPFAYLKFAKGRLFQPIREESSKSKEEKEE